VRLVEDDWTVVSKSVNEAEKAVDKEAVVDKLVLALAASVAETEQLVVCGCTVSFPTPGGAGRQRAPFPPARHEQTAEPVPVLAFTLQKLFATVSGPKQSALALHDPHAPAETAPLGSPDVVTTPFSRLQRWKNLPLPTKLTVDMLYPLEPLEQLLSRKDVTLPMMVGKEVYQ
jgi:hypothetical protein